MSYTGRRLEVTLQRRTFLATSLAASAASLARSANAQPAAGQGREYYQIRRYSLQAGPQTALTETYLGQALIPALSRMGMGPIGAFRIEIGPETPIIYVLIPGSSPDGLVQLDFNLARDTEFMKDAEPFWSASASAPAFERVEYSLLVAFEGWPRITPPAKGKRIFQLRTYESPSYKDHVVKVQMFHSGEFEVFKNAGFHPVFFGDTLIGPRMPNLTYMLSMADAADMDTKWETFRNDPAWKKLSSDPRFSFEPIVTNITNLVLSPLAASQI